MLGPLWALAAAPKAAPAGPAPAPCPKMLPAEPKVPAAVPKMLPLDAALVAPAAPLEAESEKIPPLLPLLAVKMLLPEADRADEETPAEPVEAGADEVKIPPPDTPVSEAA
mmetsp:Transcript_32340/g.66688  ORF Transcript_32340/g.66688 Transcript_32340/m.66688 type:complete len:111 (+) Transcript_32340:33-365(+)